MKTIKICILFFLISINLFAQNNKHTFAYNTSVNFYRKINS